MSAVSAVGAVSPEECALRIAHNIRAELVCCDAYERYAHNPEDAENRGHGLCYWGEAAARVAMRAAGEPRPIVRNSHFVAARHTSVHTDWLTLNQSS